MLELKKNEIMIYDCPRCGSEYEHTAEGNYFCDICAVPLVFQGICEKEIAFK